MRAWLLLFSLLPGLSLAEACVVHSQAERLDVKVCQENRNIPTTLFRDGFCQPQLQGQTVEVEFVEQCPKGCLLYTSPSPRDATLSRMPSSA